MAHQTFALRLGSWFQKIIGYSGNGSTTKHTSSILFIFLEKLVLWFLNELHFLVFCKLCTNIVWFCYWSPYDWTPQFSCWKVFFFSFSIQHLFLLEIEHLVHWFYVNMIVMWLKITVVLVQLDSDRSSVRWPCSPTQTGTNPVWSANSCCMMPSYTKASRAERRVYFWEVIFQK